MNPLILLYRAEDLLGRGINHVTSGEFPHVGIYFPNRFAAIEARLGKGLVKLTRSELINEAIERKFPVEAREILSASDPDVAWRYAMKEIKNGAGYDWRGTLAFLRWLPLFQQHPKDWFCSEICLVLARLASGQSENTIHDRQGVILRREPHRVAPEHFSWLPENILARRGTFLELVRDNLI